jgi:S1-C subfamily serine protease
LGLDAGIQTGDVFLGAGNYSSSKPNWLAEFRSAYTSRIGEPVTVYLMRNGKPLTLSLNIMSETFSTWKLQPIEKGLPDQMIIFNDWLR